MNDAGGPIARERAYEAMSEERLRRIREHEARSPWLPKLPGDFSRANGETAAAFDARLCRAVAAWLPEVQRAEGGILFASMIESDVLALTENVK